MKYLIFFSITLIVGFTVSCSKDDSICRNAPDISNINPELEWQRIEPNLMACKTKEDVASFMKKNPVVAHHFFARSAYPSDSLFYSEILRMITDPHFDSLYQEVNQKYSSIDGLKKDFEQAFAYLLHYYPDAPIPTIKTVISGLKTDLYVSDTLIIIGLDYFLGPTSKYRPQQLPEYIARRFQEEYIVPMVMLLINNRYNKIDYRDQTLLADMIFYGKSYYFARHMMPCSHDSLVIWYTAKELEDVQENDHIIWANFVYNELLYETNPAKKDKFIGERPHIYEIGENCPGRIAQWVGWEIVRKYMDKNKGITLPQLMQKSNVREIFESSGYKPSD